MAYTDRNAILAYVNSADMIPFLDDDGDGNEDTGRLDSIISTASTKVDGWLASVYSTPFSPVPAKVASFTTIIVCYMLYRRRLVPDEKNPHATEYYETIEQLKLISSGDLVLDLNFPRAFTQGAVVTVPVTFNGTTL